MQHQPHDDESAMPQANSETPPADDSWLSQEADAAPAEPQTAFDTTSAGVITTPLGTQSSPGELVVANPGDVEAVVPSERGLAFAAMRDVGQVRSVNQDSVFATIATVPRSGGDVPIGLFMVADGMGGHEGGEIASRMAVSTAAQVILANLIVPALDEGITEPIQTVLTLALQNANRNIWETAQANGTDMGTTCTAALLIGHTVYIGHIGDSRAYLVASDGLHSLTADHSAVGRLIELGQLDAEEAREHPLRSHLYRTVGQTPEVAVDYDSHSVGEASHLLLCSDGLWSMIDEAEILAIVRAHSWPQDICRALIAGANAAGGEDNISAVVVSLP